MKRRAAEQAHYFLGRRVGLLCCVWWICTAAWADRGQAYRVAVRFGETSTTMLIQREVLVSTRRGLRLANLEFPISERRKITHFTGTLEVGNTKDPAGKPRLFRRPAQTRSGSFGEESFSISVPGIVPGSRFSWQMDMEMGSPLFMPALQIGSAFPQDEVRFEFRFPHTWKVAVEWVDTAGLPIQKETLLEGDEGLIRLSAKHLPALHPTQFAKVYVAVLEHPGKPPGWQHIGDFIREAHAPFLEEFQNPWTEDLEAVLDSDAYIQAASDLVRNRIRYEAVDLGLHDYVSRSPSDVLKTQYAIARTRPSCSVPCSQNATSPPSPCWWPRNRDACPTRRSHHWPFSIT